MKKEIVRGDNLLISILTDKAMDVKVAYTLLTELPFRAKLNAYGAPLITTFPNHFVDYDNGISGIGLMVESHVGVVGFPFGFHQWPDKQYVNITISSCKSIDVDLVINFLKEIFRTEEIGWVKTQWPEVS